MVVSSGPSSVPRARAVGDACDRRAGRGRSGAKPCVKRRHNKSWEGLDTLYIIGEELALVLSVTKFRKMFLNTSARVIRLA
jgi:hypothetical protein